MIVCSVFQSWQLAFSAKKLIPLKMAGIYSVIYLLHNIYWIWLFSMGNTTIKWSYIALTNVYI